MNEENEATTFDNGRGTSNNDVTILNAKLLMSLKDWTISMEESCSDHKYITYNIGQDNSQKHIPTGYHSIRYRIREEKTEVFDKTFLQQIREKMNTNPSEDDKKKNLI